MRSQATFFRRSLWDAMGGVTLDDLFFDFDLFIRATRLARVYFMHRILGNYRSHEKSMFFSGEYKRNDAWVTRRRYMGKWARLPTWFFKPVALLSLTRRTLWYARLGDWDYIFGGLKRRTSKFLPSQWRRQA